MKRPFFYIFLLLFFQSSICMHEIQLGPNELFAWQIFGTRNLKKIDQLYRQLARKFHPDRYNGPSKEEIFKIISSSYTAIYAPINPDKQEFKLNSVIKDSKLIHKQYIKPYLITLQQPSPQQNPSHSNYNIKPSPTFNTYAHHTKFGSNNTRNNYYHYHNSAESFSSNDGHNNVHYVPIIQTTASLVIITAVIVHFVYQLLKPKSNDEQSSFAKKVSSSKQAIIKSFNKFTSTINYKSHILISILSAAGTYVILNQTSKNIRGDRPVVFNACLSISVGFLIGYVYNLLGGPKQQKNPKVNFGNKSDSR